MSVVAPGRRVRLAPPPVTSPAPPSRKWLNLPAGWPLFALFAGYPAWWLLGLGQFACFVFAVPMAHHLLKRTRIEVSRGVGVWLLFLVWVTGGVLLLQVAAPGTVDFDSYTRYITFFFRLLWYVCAFVVLLYVANTRDTLSNSRLARAFGAMFIVVVAGGWLGMLLPGLEFKSAIEYVLPSSLANNGFLNALIHPRAAQVQAFLGYEHARPSAPFAYTNIWGLNFAAFLPFFVLSWIRPKVRWRRSVGFTILALSIVPVIGSLNRGLWLALIVTTVFIAVRYAVMGQVRMLAAVGAVVIAVTATILLSPLSTLISDRQAHQHSNEGRENLGSLTIDSVTSGSPLLGFGTTRDVLGNFNSIATAATANCPGCSPPALGTQGQFWLVLFSQGFVGVALYFGFFIGQLIRHMKRRSAYAVAGSAVVVTHLVTSPVYSAPGPALLAIMGGVGLMWRASFDAQPADSVPRFREYWRPVRTAWLWLLVGTVVGAVVGVSLPTATAPARASQTIFLPSEQVVGAVTERAATIDTNAQLVRASDVVDAVRSAIPGNMSAADISDRLRMTSTPNTRFVHLQFTSDDDETARTAVNAATTAFLILRHDLIQDDQDRLLDALRTRNRELSENIVTVRITANQARPAANLKLSQTLDRLQSEAALTSAGVALLASRTVVGGQKVGAVHVTRSSDNRLIAGTTGAMTGLILGILLATALARRGSRVRDARRLMAHTGLPVLATISLPPEGRLGATQARTAMDQVLATAPVRSVQVGVPPAATPQLTDVATRLDELIDVPGQPAVAGTLLVISPSTSLKTLALRQQALRHGMQRPVGVVMVVS